ncbi:MAG: hypothetical protein ACLRSW_11235 [Christensenellaceae bacterium]
MKLRFDQPFGFVFSNLNSKLYTGDHFFFPAFLSPLIGRSISALFGARPFEEITICSTMRCVPSIFGEFSYWQGEGFGRRGDGASVPVRIFAVCRAHPRAVSDFQIRQERRTGRREWKKSARDVFFTFLLVQSQALSEIYFYISMPYGCTMDFRYIMPMILGMGLTLWLVERRLTREGDALS